VKKRQKESEAMMNNKYAFAQIGYVYIPTTRMGESVAWYTENLNFQLINRFKDRGSDVAVLHHPHQHAIALLLIETKDRRPLEIVRNGQPYPIMAIQCPDINDAHERLRGKGLEVSDLQTLGNGEAKYFYFRDNEGHLLEAAWSIWDPRIEWKKDFAARIPHDAGEPLDEGCGGIHE